MAKSQIGYDNILLTATLTGTSVDSDYPLSNLKNWNSYQQYKPADAGTKYINIDAGAAVDVDYIGIFNHNLGQTSSTIKLQWSNDGSTGWTDLTSALTANNGRTIYDSFTQVSKQYFRLEITGSTDLAVGIIAVGEALELYRHLSTGFAPPHMTKKATFNTNLTDTAMLLGRSVKNIKNELKFSMEAIPATWIRDNWEAFTDHAEQKAFFFSWDAENYVDEAVFCIAGNSIAAPKYTHSAMMSISFRAEAYYKVDNE